MGGKSFLGCLFVIACLNVGWSPRLAAQTATTGELTGTVSDSTGAMIPGVEITATNTETALERTVTTNENGFYRFALLPPGGYKVKFSLVGFKSVEAAGIRIAATESVVLNRSLEVGAQAEQVTVEAAVETLQTTTSTVGTVVPANTITALALPTRNYTGLLSMSAGAVANVGNAMGFGKGGADVAVNGLLNSQNTFAMDGVAINGAGSGSAVQGFYVAFAIPNPDMLQEFKIQTSLYDAGYGRNPGANMNVVTRSGTNEFHGTAFEFFRNTALNATDFFRNRSCGLNPTSCPGGAKQIFNQNQFGGQVGGPVKKDKFFFFAAYQQTWQKNGAADQGFRSGITLAPIPNMDRGRTSLAGVNDPAAAAFQRALGAAFCGQPTNPGAAGAGQGMQVGCDGSNINPYAMRFLQARNADGSYHIPGSGTLGFVPGVTYTIPAYDREYQGMLNLDYVINPRHTLVSRFFKSVELQDINFFGNAGANPPPPPPVPGTSGNTVYGYQNAVLKLTSILSNRLVNEVRGWAIRPTSDQTQKPNPTQYADKIYLNVAPGHGLVGGTTPLPPQLQFQGQFSAFGGTNDVIHHQTTLGVGDQLSFTQGKHSLRFGGELEAIRWVWVGSWLSHGVMAFQTFSDFLIGLPGACGTPVLPGVDPARPLGCNGSNFSNVLNTTNFTVASPPAGLVHGYRMRNGSWFVQDDFRFNNRLTLNLGLRWEYDGRLSDKYGNLVALWPSAMAKVNSPDTLGNSPATGSYAGWVVPSNYSTNTWGPLPPGIISSGRKIGTSPVPLHNFAPRLGLAWQPLASNRVVMRGGFGFFYDRVPGNTEVHAVEESPPYGFKLDQGASSNQFSSLAKPFQDYRIGQFPIRWVNFQTGLGSDITEPTLAEKFLTPLVYSWNLNLQYEFMPRWVLEFGYVGSHGTHLGQWLHTLNVPGLASPANPINGVTTNTVVNARLRAPYLGISPTGLQIADTNGDSKFNSFQATVRKQLSYGLTFQAAYTFSRAFTTQNGPATGPNLGNPLDLRQQYGPNAQYRPHRVITNYSWDIPGRNLTGFAGKVLGGWTLAGVTTIQSGQWMSITDTRGGAIYGMSSAAAVVTSRAQMASGATYKDIITPGPVSNRLGGASGGPGYFNRAALTTIPIVGVDPNVPGTGGTGWGNSGVGIILGPGQANFDATLSKMTRVGGIHENANLQFRAEFFNVFNHPQFSNPANNLANANFGQITSSSVNPRLIQLALKYIF